MSERDTVRHDKVRRVAIVTGAGSGVGRATALRLASQSVAVLVADLRLTAAIETVRLVESSGGVAIESETDVSDEASVADMVTTAVSEFGRLDYLHNNAAALGTDVYGRDLRVHELDLDVWNRTLAVNTTGALLGIKHAVPAMKRAGGGSIVSTVSVAALHGGDDHASYGVSKAAVVSLTRYVASMYGPDRIRCNAVAPGLILSETSIAALGERELAAFAAERALPWAADPEDIAATVVWLLGDESRCITGQTIVVDSGIMVRRPRDTMASWEAVLAGAAD
jgi:NAD(P)-dependent dehydrogenase (short-subunit alcohol dehydrogenase family)